MHHSFAVLSWTQFLVGVFYCLVELVQLSVLQLHLQGQTFEEIAGSVEEGLTLFMGAVDFLEVVDFVNDVVVETGLTEVSVFTLAQ